ncbi:hypothetical protein H3H36_18715 [Duganella sp. FT3S]|uniref:Uncharacterized protein n=1 Tax=Rugamonas fusca TaxID=2758568 RepID=A0A7W2EK57_9BURK|nr:hypothetical protein [Rugamonas fusca]MBA5607393.1 hypothetical protein [Rugamonas fusca]
MRIFFAFVVAIAGVFWFERFSSATFEIADTKFCLPRRYVVNAPFAINKDLLDASHGIFIELPTSSTGNEGFLLQPSKDRKGRGFPDQFVVSIGDDKKRCSKESSFARDENTGWFFCKDGGALKDWYFESVPKVDDDVYSVHSAFCDESEMCTLQFNYKAIDVMTYIEKRNFRNLSAHLSLDSKMLIDISRK